MKSFIAYYNGLQELSGISIALNDAGFTFGATITDQCRTYHCQPFRLEDHLARFCQGCAIAQLGLDRSADEIRDILENVLAENKRAFPEVTEWSLVWLATPGQIGSFLGQPGGVNDVLVNFIAYCFPLPLQRFAPFYRTGVKIITYDPKQRLPEEGRPSLVDPVQIKHRSRLAWWVAEKTVRAKDPNAQALWVDSQGFVTETAMANLVVVKDGQCLTPRGSQTLPGISLKVVAELCEQLGMQLQEGDVHSDLLPSVEEAFLCSTPYGIAPIGTVNEQALPIDGPVFNRLLREWNALIGLDIRQQFLSASS